MRRFFLLDGPLSAVDQHTCNHIFEHCIKGLLADKLVILVTHQLHLLSECDIVAIVKDCAMVYCGPYNDESISKHMSAAAAQIAVEGSHHHKTRDPKKKNKRRDSVREIPTGALTFADRAAAADRKVTLATYMGWIRQGTRVGVMMALLVLAGTQVVRIISDLFVREWTNNNKAPNQAYYVKAYAGYVAAFLVLLLLRGWSFFTLALRAASRLHNKMFAAVLRAPISFFTLTPMGPLLNCFSKQQDQVDETLPDAVHMGGIYLMILCTTIGVVISVIPYFALVLPLLVAMFVGMQWFQGTAAEYLKNRLAVTNPPIYAHVAESLSGILVVRAFDAEERFKKDNRKMINTNHRIVFGMDQLQCWAAFRLDLFASLLVLATAFFCVGLRTDIKGSSAGLAISNSLQMLVFLTLLVRAFTEARSQMNAVESILFLHEERRI
eukprot:Opistho-2@78074